MNNVILKKNWVGALRSGKYEQGLYSLRSKDNKYCCLGVLCDVINPSDWVEQLDGGYTYLGRGGVLPISIQEKFGVDEAAQGALVNMNDRGDTFEQIADYIEKEL